MKIIIAAGTGFLGKILTNHFKDHELIVLSRAERPRTSQIKYVKWDAKTIGTWQKELEHADVLINLAGKSVDCRYTKQNKAAIRSSRIESTEVLNAALLACENPPKHFINASTARIYKHSETKEMDEKYGEIGSDFSMDVAKDWEATFYGTLTPHTLKTAARIGIVLGKNGGAFVPLQQITKCGFGGKCGKGTQFISWIHEVDFAKAISFIIKNKIGGSVNLVSPKPTKNEEFMQKLSANLGVKFGIPIPEWLLKFGAVLIRTEGELLLKSRNVIPGRLKEHHFSFEFGNIDAALKNLTT